MSSAVCVARSGGGRLGISDGGRSRNADSSAMAKSASFDFLPGNSFASRTSSASLNLSVSFMSEICTASLPSLTLRFADTNCSNCATVTICVAGVGAANASGIDIVNRTGMVNLRTGRRSTIGTYRDRTRRGNYRESASGISQAAPA